MKRETVLLFVVVVLVILNGIVLLHFSWKRQAPVPPPHDKIIIETLQFDDAQQQVFEKLKRKHRSKMDSLEELYAENLENYFQSLKGVQTTPPDSLDRVLAILEQARIHVTYDHFKELKELCRADQQQKFDAFIPRLLKFIVPPPKKRKHPPEGMER